MRKRATSVSLLAAAALLGGAAVAGSAGASTPPDGGGSGAGAGRGSDSGLDGYDLAGTTVTLGGVEESVVEAGGMQAALDAFAEENGMTITYTGVRSFEGDIGVAVEGGTPPDIGIFPQPGRVAGFAASGDVYQLPDDVVAAVGENWDSSWLANTNFDGAQYGVPLKSDLKSVVWYEPARWAELGYEVPTTLDDFIGLVDTMAADGNTPLCVGIGSDAATGWPFTDWVEELVLRNYGIDFYNQWVDHEVPFNSPEILATFEEVMDIWAPENVYAAGGSIQGTNFGDNAEPLLAGDCMMHRQASFFAANLATAGATFGTEAGQIDAFYFPANEGHPTLTGGLNAAAFADRPEVWAVMQYLGSSDYANARQEAQAQLAVEDSGDENASSGFLTAAKGADLSLWGPLEGTFVEILQAADPAGFDASDLMPTEVGSGAFWTEGTAFVNGDIDAQTAVDNIEAAWPAG